MGRGSKVVRSLRQGLVTPERGHSDLGLEIGQMIPSWSWHLLLLVSSGTITQEISRTIREFLSNDVGPSLLTSIMIPSWSLTIDSPPGALLVSWSVISFWVAQHIQSKTKRVIILSGSDNISTGTNPITHGDIFLLTY